MSRPRGTVWIAEDDAFDETPARGIVWTGRFSAWHDLDDGSPAGQLDGATADEAVAWGRARAPVVWIRLADSGYFAAGDDHDGAEARWEPALAPRRRRPPGEQWRDRAEDADPVDWLVEVDLSPPWREPRPDWETEIARIAGRGGATGWRARRIEPPPSAAGEDDAWFVGGEEISDRALLTLDRGGETGWVGYDTTTFRLTFTLPAATVVHAMEYALDRCVVASGWAATAYGRPAPAPAA